MTIKKLQNTLRYKQINQQEQFLSFFFFFNQKMYSSVKLNQKLEFTQQATVEIKLL